MIAQELLRLAAVLVERLGGTVELSDAELAELDEPKLLVTYRDPATMRVVLRVEPGITATCAYVDCDEPGDVYGRCRVHAAEDPDPDRHWHDREL